MHMYIYAIYARVASYMSTSILRSECLIILDYFNEIW